MVSMSSMHQHDEAQDPLDFWDARYLSTSRVWSGNVNSTLESALVQITPGDGAATALDLGSGEGGDVLWLAQHGWDATGVELSPVAVERARQRASELGLDNRAHFVAHDLTTWEPGPDSSYDLVTASFFQSPVRLERGAILRAAAGRIAPGGHLVILSHAAPPSWHAGGDSGPKHFFSPEDELALLELDPARWDVLRCEVVLREATGPEGQKEMLKDTIVVVRAK